MSSSSSQESSPAGSPDSAGGNIHPGIASIRTIALAGPAGAGKTTLLEALLLQSGTIAAAGSVERGSTVSDHDPLEKKM